MENNQEQAAQDSIGHTFVTKDAPYFKYLRRLPSGIPGVNTLTANLDKSIEQIQHCINQNKIMFAPAAKILEIVDLNDDGTLELVAVSSLHEMRNGTASQVESRVTHVNRLLEALVDVPSNCVTRILLLTPPSHVDGKTSAYGGGERAPAGLLFAHILGEVLGLAPCVIARFCQFDAISTRDHELLDTSLAIQEGGATFGSLVKESESCLVQWLGSHDLGMHKVNIVIIRASTDWLERHDVFCEALENGPMSLPLMPYAYPRLYPDHYRTLPSHFRGEWRNGLRVIRISMVHILKTYPPSAEQSIVWLQALLWLECEAYEKEHTRLWTLSKSLKGHMQQPDTRVELWRELRQLEDALSSSMNQASMLLKCVQASSEDDLTSPSEDDLRPILGRATQLQQRILRTIRMTKDAAEVGVQAKSLEMTQTAIDENRAVTALSTMAFLFLPVSLASSVFGMNVQEINQTGQGIWQFAATSVALLVLAMMALLWWKVQARWQYYRSGLLKAWKILHNWPSNAWAPYTRRSHRRQQLKTEANERIREKAWDEALERRRLSIERSQLQGV